MLSFLASQIIDVIVEGPEGVRWTDLQETASGDTPEAVLARFGVGGASWSEVEALFPNDRDDIRRTLSIRLEFHDPKLHGSRAYVEHLIRVLDIDAEFPRSNDPSLGVVHEADKACRKHPLYTRAVMGHVWLASGNFNRLIEGRDPPPFSQIQGSWEVHAVANRLAGGLFHLLQHGWDTVPENQRLSFFETLLKWGERFGGEPFFSKETDVSKALGFNWADVDRSTREILGNACLSAHDYMGYHNETLSDDARERAQWHWLQGYQRRLEESVSSMTIEDAAKHWRTAPAPVRMAIEKVFGVRKIKKPGSPLETVYHLEYLLGHPVNTVASFADSYGHGAATRQ